MTSLFRHNIRSEILLLYVIENLVCFAAFYLILQGGIGALPVERSGELMVAGILTAGAGLACGVSGLYQPNNWLRIRRLVWGVSITSLFLLLLAQLAFPALLPARFGDTVWLWGLAMVAGFVPAFLLTRLMLVAAGRAGLLRLRIVLLHATGQVPEPRSWMAQDPFLDVVLSLPADQAGTLDAERLRALKAWAVVAQPQAAMPETVAASLASQGIAAFREEEFFERRLGRVDLAALPANWQPAHQARDGMVEATLRRGFDIVLSFGLLLFTLPLLLLAAAAIRLDSPGPVFYRQERVGKDGRSFNLLKFRSMGVDAEAGGAPRWASKQDPRVTRVGRIMRLTRIDEIPQVLNVLRGDMAFVGPRPERPAFTEQLAQVIPHYNQRALVKPGITGWAQVNYPYGASVEDTRMKLSYDFYYIKRRSLFLDMLILIATVRVVLFQEGSQ